jgi:hypothetical protein
MRADTATYLASPLVFLVSSLVFLASLGFVAAIGNVPYAVAAWIFGFLGTNFLVVPLVFVESAFRRKARLLLLIPGLYWYWLLQVLALAMALVRLTMVGNVRWERTPKRRID